MVQVEPTPQEIELQTTENIKGHILTNLIILYSQSSIDYIQYYQ